MSSKQVSAVDKAVEEEIEVAVESAVKQTVVLAEGIDAAIPMSTTNVEEDGHPYTTNSNQLPAQKTLPI